MICADISRGGSLVLVPKPSNEARGRLALRWWSTLVRLTRTYLSWAGRHIPKRQNSFFWSAKRDIFNRALISHSAFSLKGPHGLSKRGQQSQSMEPLRSTERSFAVSDQCIVFDLRGHDRGSVRSHAPATGHASSLMTLPVHNRDRAWESGSSRPYATSVGTGILAFHKEACSETSSATEQFCTDVVLPFVSPLARIVASLCASTRSVC